MGSGNSSPVGRAKTVETVAHQDVFKLRFDHLAFGGTAVVAIIIGIGLYCLYQRKKKRRHRGRRRRQSRDYCQHGFPMMQYLPFPKMPPFPPYPMMPQAANPWMEVARQPIYNSHRFSEIQETPTTSAAPARPPPPRARELLSPRSKSAEESN